MTRVEKHDRLSGGGAHKAGWLVSIGLHGSLILGALILLQQMHLALQPEPFEWNVAMVQPVDSHSPAAVPNESPPSPPSTPAQPSVPAQKHPAAASVEPLPASLVPFQAPPTPTNNRPPHAEPAPPSPVQATGPSKTEPMPEPIRDEPHSQPHAAVRSDEPPHQPPVQESPVASTSPTTAAVQSSAPVVQESAPSNTTSPPATPAEPSSASTNLAALTPTGQSNATKPDDGWLSELMAKWIVELEKHYPAALRMEGVQGKVVLVAMLHENGTLSDVKIAKSSGNVLLDQAAIADVEHGPPIKLSRPLGRPQRSIKFSISYDLKTAR